MKTLFKSKIALIIIIAGLTFSCKKNETEPEDNYGTTDSTVTTIDSVNTGIDTTTTNTGTRGTTGAEGTTQNGNTSIRTDSTTTAPKR